RQPRRRRAWRRSTGRGGDAGEAPRLRPLHDYRSFVFDCDGVILDSNRLQTEAFRAAALPYGVEAAAALVDYHVANGGISRYVKLDRFLREMVPRGADGPDLNELLERFAAHVREGLLRCDVAERLDELRRSTPTARWIVASGG